MNQRQPHAYDRNLIYIAALSLRFALGRVILTSVGAPGLALILIAGGIALVAPLSVAMPWVRAPAFERPSHPNRHRDLALAPVALIVTLVNAALETAGMSFLPLYAMNAGWNERAATLLLSVLQLGAIIPRLPIGGLGDRMAHHPHTPPRPCLIRASARNCRL